jgi:transcriptional regulator with XRE-family HTH domain
MFKLGYIAKKIYPTWGIKIMTLGEALAIRIQHYLDERSITLYRLAKDSTISISTLNGVISGHSKNPSFVIFYQLANGLGITVKEFLDDEIFNENNIDY